MLLGRHGPHQRPHAGLGDPLALALALALALGHLGVVLGVAGPQPVPVMVAVLGTQTLGTLTAYAKIQFRIS